MKYLQTFTVKSDLQFPVDMLRYDCCWPLSEKDSGIIANSLSMLSKRAFKVELGRWVNTKKASPPTIERWASFGCTVSNTEVK